MGCVLKQGSIRHPLQATAREKTLRSVRKALRASPACTNLHDRDDTGKRYK